MAIFPFLIILGTTGYCDEEKEEKTENEMVNVKSDNWGFCSRPCNLNRAATAARTSSQGLPLLMEKIVIFLCVAIYEHHQFLQYFIP